MRVNDKVNVQVRMPRRRSQRCNVEDALVLVKFALDCVDDCVAVGGDVLPGWLSVTASCGWPLWADSPYI